MKEHTPIAHRVTQRAWWGSRNRKLIITGQAKQSECHGISILLAQGQRLMGIWCSEAGITSPARKRSWTEELSTRCWAHCAHTLYHPPLHPLALLWCRPELSQLEMASVPHHWLQVGICQIHADLSGQARWLIPLHILQGKVQAL